MNINREPPPIRPSVTGGVFSGPGAPDQKFLQMSD